MLNADASHSRVRDTRDVMPRPMDGGPWWDFMKTSSRLAAFTALKVDTLRSHSAAAMTVRSTRGTTESQPAHNKEGAMYRACSNRCYSRACAHRIA